MKREQISTRLRFAVLQRDDFRCQYCGARGAQSPLEVDHILAVSRGGTNHEDNLLTACWACNNGKSADVPFDQVDRILLSLSGFATSAPTNLVRARVFRLSLQFGAADLNHAARRIKANHRLLHKNADDAWECVEDALLSELVDISWERSR